jgi:hypothetical protein
VEEALGSTDMLVANARGSLDSRRTAAGRGTCLVENGISTRRCPMARCDTCGNDYERTFQVISGGRTHTFDSFECAIHKLAPSCAHCGCKVIGHGVEASGTVYCCAHCAHANGIEEIVDNSAHATR